MHRLYSMLASTPARQQQLAHLAAQRICGSAQVAGRCVVANVPERGGEPVRGEFMQLMQHDGAIEPAGLQLGEIARVVQPAQSRRAAAGISVMIKVLGYARTMS